MGGGIEYWGGGGTVLYLQCMYLHTIFQDVILISFDRPDTLTNLDILSRQGALQKRLQDQFIKLTVQSLTLEIF